MLYPLEGDRKMYDYAETQDMEGLITLGGGHNA